MGALVCAAVVTTGPVAAAGGDPASGAPQGNASPQLQSPTGVGVAAQSAPTDREVALVLQNTTTKPVRVERITAVAARADGSYAARGSSVTAYPQVIAPGGLALAMVRFPKPGPLPTDRVTTKVTSTPVSATAARRVLAVGGLQLSPPQTGPAAQTLAATVTNPTTTWTALRPEAAVVCFGQAGNPSTFADARTSARRLRPGARASLTITLTSLCPSYLVAARAS